MIGRDAARGNAPGNAVFGPAFIEGGVVFRVVESRRVHFEPLGDRRIVEFQRSAAVTAKRPFAVGKMQHLGMAGGPCERAAAEERPGDKRCATGFTTVLAVTK